METILVVLASNSGNTRTFLEFLSKHCKQNIRVCDDFSISPSGYDRIAFGSYTWGNGKIPNKMKKYLIENHKELDGKQIFIFGSGYSIYPHFCRAVDSISKICSDSKADVKGTFKFEQRFNEKEWPLWQIETLSSLIEDWSA